MGLGVEPTFGEQIVFVFWLQLVGHQPTFPWTDGVVPDERAGDVNGLH